MAETTIISQNGGKPQKRYKPVSTILLIARYNGEPLPPYQDPSAEWFYFGRGSKSRTKSIEGETSTTAYFLTDNDEPDGNEVEEKTSTKITLSDEGDQFFGNLAQDLIYECALSDGDDNKVWVWEQQPTGRWEFYLSSIPKLETGGDGTAFSEFKPEFSLGAPILVINPEEEPASRTKTTTQSTKEVK